MLVLQEDFLDICLALGGHSSLEEALDDSYKHTETMTGNNKYHCEKCRKLVDAEKVCI